MGSSRQGSSSVAWTSQLTAVVGSASAEPATKASTARKMKCRRGCSTPCASTWLSKVPRARLLGTAKPGGVNSLQDPGMAGAGF
ncbi:MAG: hypothetical protein ACI9MR_002665 [Myxococcota bacterium]|jgi:hypothetical protein